MFVSIYYKPSLFNARTMILIVHIFMNVNKLCLNQSYIEPCFGIGLSLSLICQLTSEDIKQHCLPTYLSTYLPTQSTQRAPKSTSDGSITNLLSTLCILIEILSRARAKGAKKKVLMISNLTFKKKKSFSERRRGKHGSEKVQLKSFCRSPSVIKKKSAAKLWISSRQLAPLHLCVTRGGSSREL